MQGTVKQPSVIVFTGGGTGGHVFPGVALVEALQKKAEFRLIWIGSATGLERQVIEGLGWEYRAISTGKLRRYFSWKNLTDLFRIAAGYFQARRLLRELQPVFVFSKGGFVSVPPVWAAQSLRIPVYSHESDMDPGLATRLNLSASKVLFVGYEKTKNLMAQAHRERVMVSGNPVRQAFFTPAAPNLATLFAVPAGVPVLVVLGGSQGARQINTLVQAALPFWEGKVFVVHQTGAQAETLPSTPWYVSRPFFTTEMPALMQGATLVFGRSGAGTLWEAAACGVPLLLLPLDGGSRGDQVRNAAYFAEMGAAVVVGDEETGEGLAARVVALLAQPETLASMKAGLSGFHAQSAADTMADVLRERHLV